MNTSSDATEGASRRCFLKTSAALVPAALAGLAIPAAHTEGSAIFKVGVIGCGGRGEAAAMNAMNAGKDVHIVAMGDILLDRIQEKRSSLKLKYPGQVDVPDEHCFTGFDAYKHVIEVSDVVIIANAAKFHSFHAKAAIEAGKHVFVEKPHAIDPVGIQRLGRPANSRKAKSLSIVSGLQSRYHPGYRETMQRVHDGAIGDIVAIQETWLRPPYVLYPRRPGMKEVEFQASNQYHFHWLSGDDVPQTLIHNLDRSSWALLNAAPLRCYAMGGRSTLHGEVYGDTFDHNAVVYDFPKGVRVYAFCRTIDNCYEENSSLILGQQGALRSAEAADHGRDQLGIAGGEVQGQRLRPGTRRAVQRHPHRQARQQRRLHGAQHADRHHRPVLFLHRQGGDVGAVRQVGFLLSAVAGEREHGHGTARQARPGRHLSGLHPRSNQAALTRAPEMEPRAVVRPLLTRSNRPPAHAIPPEAPEESTAPAFPDVPENTV